MADLPREPGPAARNASFRRTRTAARATMVRRSLSFVRLVSLLSLLVLSGCVYGPENNDWVDWSRLTFRGFAENPAATIEIQAYNQRTGVWNVVTTATSTSSPTTFGGQQLYSWSLTNFDFFASVPDAACYWSSHVFCAIPGGFASAKFRFKEQGSALAHLVTFDDGGVACVIDQVDDGEDWFAAGSSCSSDDSPVLTLRVLT
ncbi:hypothetical protein [Chondromyces crocatus]|nr:hypothetical protein [Chondromyces crocatus]